MRSLRQAATAGAIGCVGDVIMQRIEGKALPQEIDGERAGRMSVFRMLQAPIQDVAWQTFDRRILLPGAAGVAAKVAADQILISTSI
jgi:hypothetical protein